MGRTTELPTGARAGTLRVAIVDDDPSIRTVLRLLLAASGRARLVAEADGAETVVSLCDAPDADVVLLDHDLGGSCGLDLLPLVRTWLPDAMVAVFSSKPAEFAAAPSLRAGADVYYEKSLLGADLIDRLQTDLDARRNRG